MFFCYFFKIARQLLRYTFNKQDISVHIDSNIRLKKESIKIPTFYGLNFFLSKKEKVFEFVRIHIYFYTMIHFFPSFFLLIVLVSWSFDHSSGTTRTVMITAVAAAFWLLRSSRTIFLWFFSYFHFKKNIFKVQHKP